jgi:uncharacterized RDD family membrane protein YckC
VSFDCACYGQDFLEQFGIVTNYLPTLTRQPLSVLVPPLSGDPLSILNTVPQDLTIGSLWRRIVAFALDATIVGVAASLIAFPLFETFSHLGLWGRLVGFCMALPYFATLNSTIGNGQTLGKRWMRLQVVDMHGNTIPFWKSLCRYAVFAVPYYLNEISLPVTRTPWIVSSVISLVIFAVGGATFYLVFFNRQTRQGIHDLAVGSYVAEADKIGPLKTQAIWKMHWMILGSLLVVLSLATGILENKLMKWGAFPQMLEDVRLVENMEGVQHAGVQDLNWSNRSSGGKKKIFVINVFWTGKSADEEAFADRVVKLVLQNDPKVQEHDLLRVVITRGYDLGIAHAQFSHPFERTPADWKARLSGSSLGERST